MDLAVARDRVTTAKDTVEKDGDAEKTPGGNTEPECSTAAHAAVRAARNVVL